MSEQQKSVLDEQAALVRAVYRALPEEDIPAELEQRILENAAAAIKPSSTRHGQRWSWLKWSGPLASAAVVLLVVAVVMQPQSQREIVPQQAASPPVANEPVATPEPADAPAIPRLPVEKPDLSASPNIAETLRTQARRPRALADSSVAPPVPAITTSPAPQMVKRNEAASEASQPPQAVAAESGAPQAEREQDRPAMPASFESGGASGSVGPAVAADKARVSSFLPAAPAAALAKSMNPALDISPELRARLEKFSRERKKTNASAGDSTLEQLRRDYPGVDIDAALRALEQTKVEGPE